jgi:hypothetical protein
MNVEAAVKNAISGLKDAFDGEELHGLKLEEVERADSGEAWHITLGFDRSVALSPSAVDRALHKWRRVYKVVKVNSETGEAESIKILENV